LDTNLPFKNRPPLPPTNQLSSRTSQLQRINCQRRSPNSSPVLPQAQQRCHQNTTTTTTTTSTTSTKNQTLTPSTKNQTLTSSTTAKGYRNGRYHYFFSSNNNNNNNYYSSKMNRSIVNCEKFLLDQDLINSTKDNDLLLIHARQSKHFT
jgi:hypothetical protein